MEPLYHRGDIIVLQGASFQQLAAPEVRLDEQLEGKAFAYFAVPKYAYSGGRLQIDSISFSNGQEIKISREGSIVVYFSQHRKEPIIHRVVAKLAAKDGSYVLTKGDSVLNSTIDQDCGRVVYGAPEAGKECISLYPVKESEVMGKALLQIPLVGCAKLWLFDDLSSLITKGRLPADFRGIC